MIKKLWLALGALAVAAIGVAAYFSYGSYGGEHHGSGLEDWVAGSQLGQSIGTLVGDRAHVERAISSGAGLKAVHTICAAMAIDAGKANDSLPSPDTTLTGLLAKAYGAYYDAASTCSATTELALGRSARRRADDWNHADRLFHEALELVRSETDRSVPTTTTTVPDVTGTTFL